MFLCGVILSNSLLRLSRWSNDEDDPFVYDIDFAAEHFDLKKAMNQCVVSTTFAKSEMMLIMMTMTSSPLIQLGSVLLVF